jgi:PAS domain S-box-containing protein
MTAWTQALAQLPNYGADSAITLALRLAHAEKALHALTSGQVDAIVDPSGETYLLRPAQEHLRQNEGRLQALIGSIADVITVVNHGGTILFQSTAVTKVLGYGPEELLGTSIFEFVHPDDLAKVYSAFFNVFEGIFEDATVQFRHRVGDGTFRIIEATVGRLNDPTSTNVVLSLRPATLCAPERAESAGPSTVPDVSELTTQGPAARKDGVHNAMDHSA